MSLIQERVIYFIFLTVEPEIIIIQLQNETTLENSQAALIGEVEGEFAPEIIWKKALMP